MKNAPARTRAANRTRSSYSNPQREGGAKAPFLYSSWARADMHGGGNLPAGVRDELALARRNPRAFKARRETPETTRVFNHHRLGIVENESPHIPA